MVAAVAHSAVLWSSLGRPAAFRYSPAANCRHSNPSRPLPSGFTTNSRPAGAPLQAPGAAVAGAAASSAAAPSAAAAASGAATVLGLQATALFGISSAVMVPVYSMLAFFPTSRLTCSTLLDSPALYLGLALLYTATLVAAWQAGLGAALGAVVGSFPLVVTSGAGLGALDLSPLARMFALPLVTLLAWLHLLVLDALMAREILLDGVRTGVVTAHSVLLCFFFGPMGLLSHAITRALMRQGPASI